MAQRDGLRLLLVFSLGLDALDEKLEAKDLLRRVAFLESRNATVLEGDVDVLLLALQAVGGSEFLLLVLAEDVLLELGGAARERDQL